MDWLMVKELPDMRIEDNRVVFTKVPTMVVRPSLSKARHKYFTFLTSEGCEYLQAYLEKRLAMGEELTPQSPIIAVTPGFEKMGKSLRNRGSKFITTKNVTREIREAMRPPRHGGRQCIYMLAEWRASTNSHLRPWLN